MSSYKRYTYLGFLFCISIYILSFFIPFNNKKCKYHLAVFDNYTIRSHCPRQLSWTPKARAVKFTCMYLVKGFMDITIKLISHYFENSFLRFQLFLLYGHNDNVLELELLTLGQYILQFIQRASCIPQQCIHVLFFTIMYQINKKIWRFDTFCSI